MRITKHTNNIHQKVAVASKKQDHTGPHCWYYMPL